MDVITDVHWHFPAPRSADRQVLRKRLSPPRIEGLTWVDDTSLSCCTRRVGRRRFGQAGCSGSVVGSVARLADLLWGSDEFEVCRGVGWVFPQGGVVVGSGVSFSLDLPIAVRYTPLSRDVL